LFLDSLWLLAVLSARAQEPAPGVDLAEEAEVAFEIGVQHIQKGDFLMGLSFLLESNRLAPNKNVLYNIAGAYEALGRFEQAYQYYTEYVTLEADPGRRADGQRGLDRLAGRVALVEVRSDPPGATIYVDRQDLGARGVTPRTIALGAGEHDVIVAAEGYAPAEQRLRAERGVRATADFALERLLGEVRIFGEPEGATVRLEGSEEVLGTIPSTFSVPVGETVLEVHAPGYAPRKLVTRAQTGELTSVDGTLTLLVGRVVVDTPGRTGALIEIDGEAAAFSPAVIDVPVGSHELEVSAPGYEPYVSSIEVASEQTIEIAARLRGNLLDPLVVSASRTAELLSEAPVPVTVITSDMIRGISARNLKEVLETYVPGMTNITDHNELNVAMRGVFASSQQKILVMVDGHRLNSRVYSMASPDMGLMISPDRIKQIEVLRGPGSAAYGNSAFTAVVNVITQDGPEIGGFVARVGAGNHGQATGSLVFGGGREGIDDLVIWGQTWRAMGEEVAISAEDDYALDSDGDGVPDPHAGVALVGAVRNPGSYDVGGRYEIGDFHLYGNSRYGKHTEPLTAGGITGAVYAYDQMRTIMGEGPGLGSGSNHLELGWARQLRDIHTLELTGYYDTNEISGNLTTGYDTHLWLAWRDRAQGGIGQYTIDYRALGTGSLLVGGQLDFAYLVDSILLAGSEGDWQAVGDTDQREVLLPGQEATYSGFVQLKHTFGKALLVNLGTRFDYKVRREGDPANDIPEQDDILDISPRLAAVLRPIEPLAIKLSYAESFVDAPYWYRYNNFPSYAGAVTLTPEQLRAAQLTPELTLLDGRFKSTSNLAYQSVYDFIYRDNAAEPGEPFYINAGHFDSLILEQEIAFVETAARVRANATWQRVLDVENYEAPDGGDRINYVPSVYGNLVVDVNPLLALDESLWTNVTLRVVGPMAAPIRAVSQSRPDLEANLGNEAPGYALLDVGARFERLIGGLSVDGRVTNVLDTQYTQGGATLFPYPQPGRWFLVNVEWAFDAVRADGRE
jgi:outer membrane receptor for ferrienterochelin and colicins